MLNVGCSKRNKEGALKQPKSLKG